MANQYVMVGGREIPLVVPKSDLTIESRLPGGKYHRQFFNWWKGDELFAFDSTTLESMNADGYFLDLNGTNMLAGRNAYGTSSGSRPTIAEGVQFEFGKGIRLTKYSYLASVIGNIPSDVIAKSFTMDFWMREEAAPTDQPIRPVMVYADISAPAGTSTWNNRFVFGPGTDTINDPITNLVIWNNKRSPVAIGSWPHGMKGSSWKHIAVIFDKPTNRNCFYVNGALKGFIAHNNEPVIGPSQIGIGGATSEAVTIVERVRFREGVRFDVSGFDVNLIY